MKQVKLCFSTLGCTEYSVDQVITLSEKFGIKAVELRGLYNIMNLYESEAFSKENINDTVKKFFDAGITFPVLGTSISCHEIYSGKQSLENAKRDIAFAESVKAKYIRVFGNKITDICSSPEVASALRELCNIAKYHGITVLLEVHGDYNSIETLSPIVSSLSDLDNFGLIWDICHTDAQYGDNWVQFYEKFKSVIFHIHIKDRNRESKKLTPLGKGDIPIKQITSRLLSDDFDGFISLEWERKWHKELSPIEDALSDFVRIMDEI